jgi:carbamoyl-phosphate synthase large subunit
VADGGFVGDSEHIEDAGTSGDATLCCRLKRSHSIRRVKQIATTLARALSITGRSCSVSHRHNAVKVISACGFTEFSVASKVMVRTSPRKRCAACSGSLAKSQTRPDLDVGVKPMFSFSGNGADPMLGVEMMSTGEVGIWTTCTKHCSTPLATVFSEKGAVVTGPRCGQVLVADEAEWVDELYGHLRPGTAGKNWSRAQLLKRGQSGGALDVIERAWSISSLTFGIASSVGPTAT